MAADTETDVAAGTLEGLRKRLRNIEWLVSGRIHEDKVVSASHDEPVAAHLERLETGLQALSTKSPAIKELLQLYKNHPDLFPPSGVSPSSSFTTQEQLATINACATSFSSTASQLTSVQDSPMPSAESSAALVAVRPRLIAVAQRQAAQNRQLAELRLKSATLLTRWSDGVVMSSNECWAEWDQKLTEAERAVRQNEYRREQEEAPQ